MARIPKAVEIIILDVLGVILMILALLTGWLPGPGGIPLFIIGLSLLAINHEWAEKYIALLKQNAHRLGEIIFVKNKTVQILYDLFAPILLVFGIYLVWLHSPLWTITPGVFMVFLSITLFLGNRRWKRLKVFLKHKN